MRKRAKCHPSIEVTPKAKTARLDGGHLTGRRRVPRLLLFETLARQKHESPPRTKETVLGLAGLGNTGRPSRAPHRNKYMNSMRPARSRRQCTAAYSTLA